MIYFSFVQMRFLSVTGTKVLWNRQENRAAKFHSLETLKSSLITIKNTIDVRMHVFQKLTHQTYTCLSVS